MNKKFEITFNILSKRNLSKTKKLFIAERKKFLSLFEENFCDMCAEIVKLQNKSIVSAISRMEYTMLNTNFIERNYIAEIWIYDDYRYCDKKQRTVGHVDISSLFVCFDELWERVISERKRFVNKVSSNDITECMLKALPVYYAYLNDIIHSAIASCLDKKSFTDIIKNDLFRINVGDYMAKTEVMYSFNKNKDVNSLAKLIEEKNYYSFAAEDCSDLDFSGCSFTRPKLKYGHFRNSVLNDAKFYNATLTGANFRDTQMERSVLDYSFIYDADFSYANLKYASFRYALGFNNMLYSESLKLVSCFPVSFCYTDLTNVNFQKADLTGADFNNANLTNTNFVGAKLDNSDFRHAIIADTDFTDAKLTNAIFSTRDLPLSDEQLSKVIIND